MSAESPIPAHDHEQKPAEDAANRAAAAPALEIEGEIGGPSGPEPTRYGDWERKGRCIDF